MNSGKGSISSVDGLRNKNSLKHKIPYNSSCKESIEPGFDDDSNMIQDGIPKSSICHSKLLILFIFIQLGLFLSLSSSSKNEISQPSELYSNFKITHYKNQSNISSTVEKKLLSMIQKLPKMSLKLKRAILRVVKSKTTA